MISDVVRVVSVEPIFVVSDVPRALAQAGVEFVEPQDFEYGKREGSHEDPDGNLIRFGSPLRR